ncbi:MAG: hypothetical protein ACXWQZ_21805, partial [Ktedonobacterales bacterium]
EQDDEDPQRWLQATARRDRLRSIACRRGYRGCRFRSARRLQAHVLLLAVLPHAWVCGVPL